jgi:hypothetical protein
MRTYVLRGLSVVEFLIATLFVFLGGGFAVDPRARIGGDGILTGFAPVLAAFFLSGGGMLAWAGVLAWRKDRKWWRPPLLAVVIVPAVTAVGFILAAIFV